MTSEFTLIKLWHKWVKMARENFFLLRQMCNLSDLVEERGIQKGLVLGIEQGEEQKKDYK